MIPNISEIRNRRKKLGLTQNELAVKANLSRDSIGRLERGGELGYSKVKLVFDILEHEELKRLREFDLKSISLKHIHNSPEVSVDANELVHNVYAKMLDTNYSQFRVQDSSEKNYGSITEIGINRAVQQLGLEKANSSPVKVVMEGPFPMLPTSTPVSSVIPLLRQCQAVLTCEGKEIVGIVTNADINQAYRIKHEKG